VNQKSGWIEPAMSPTGIGPEPGVRGAPLRVVMDAE
jgi:hypothetical protein